MKKPGSSKDATPPARLSSCLVLATLVACQSPPEHDRVDGGPASAGGAAGAPSETASGGAAGLGGAPEPSPAPCPTYDPDAVAVPGLELLHPADRFEVYVVDADDEWAYFVEGEQLRRVALTGGTTETLGPFVGSWVRRVGDDELLWARPGADAGTQQLLRAPLTDPEDIEVVVESTPTVSHVVLDDTHVCWSTIAPYDVYRVSHDGGDPQLLVEGAQPLGAVLHAGYYYWIDAVSDHLERVALIDGTREKLVRVLFGGPMAAREDTIFWGDTVLSTIEKWSPSTGRVQLAAAIDPLQLQVWDDTLYWSQGLLSGAVRAIGIDGDDPRDLLCRLRPRTSFHITDEHVLVGGGSGLLRLDR
jgi:hypothetical protein